MYIGIPPTNLRRFPTTTIMRWTASDDLPFTNDLFKIGLSIDHKSASTSSFKLYYLNGAHLPFRMTETLDLYDSATIIITADHGENYIYAPSEYRTSELAE